MASKNAPRTIKEDTIALLTRKRPLSYEGVVEEIQKRHPECETSVKTVQWYASRLRADGVAVNVKRANDRRNWGPRAKGDASQRAH
jgi:hypothetical protein